MWSLEQKGVKIYTRILVVTGSTTSPVLRSLRSGERMEHSFSPRAMAICARYSLKKKEP